MRQGAFDYISSRSSLPQVTDSIERAIRVQGAGQCQARLRGITGRDRASEDTRAPSVNQDLTRLSRFLYSNYRATLSALAEALEARDCETRGHSDRVVAYCLRSVGSGPRTQ